MPEQGKPAGKKLRVGGDSEKVDLEQIIVVRVVQSGRDKLELFVIASLAAVAGTAVGGVMLALFL